MLRKAGNFLRYLFGILMMLAGAGYWKEEKAYALSLLLLGIFLLPVTWNTLTLPTAKAGGFLFLPPLH